MERIDYKQLSYLLSITKKEARSKIAYFHHGKNSVLSKAEIELTPSTAGVSELSEFLNINLGFFIKNIQDNVLKRGSFRGWLMDVPEEKINKAKKDMKWSLSVFIPKDLSSFLSDDQKIEILKLWKERYSNHLNVKNVEIKGLVKVEIDIHR